MDRTSLFWPLYKSIARVGSVTAIIVYGVAGLFLGAGPIAPMLEWPVIIVFCLIVAAPAALLGATVARILRRRMPTAAHRTWLWIGGGTGGALPLPALMAQLSKGPFANVTGLLFWATFVLAASLAGARAAAIAHRQLQPTGPMEPGS